jgi:hypothetical protein
LGVCALAIGVVAATDGGSDAGGDDGGGIDSGTPADATSTMQDATPAADSCPATGAMDDGAGSVQGWPGPPSVNGSLGDGSLPVVSGDIFTCLDIPMAGALPTPFSYNQVKPAYTDVKGCLAYDAQGHKASHDCLCQKCFTLLQQCDSLTACRAVLKCAEDSGCTNATSCYLGPGAPCITVINNAGTGSVSTGLEENLGTCGQNNHCPSQ